MSRTPSSRDSLVIPRAEQTLRKSLGELDAEEFYNVEKRLSRIEAAGQALRAQLEPAGVAVVTPSEVMAAAGLPVRPPII